MNKLGYNNFKPSGSYYASKTHSHGFKHLSTKKIMEEMS